MAKLEAIDLIHRSEAIASSVEISAREWLQYAKNISSETLTPWPRVSNNIFYSLQWAGRDAIEKAQRRYFGVEVDGRLVCSVGTYWLSENTLRIRDLFCLPAERRKGYMRQCLNFALTMQQPQPIKVVAFVTKSAIEFHRRCGFSPVNQWTPRSIEYYDFFTKGYHVAQGDDLILMELRSTQL